MKQTDTIFEMLELIPQPAFCVKDGTVAYINQSAKSLALSIETNIQDLLATGSQEFSEYTDGCLYLTLCINGVHHGATVTKMNNADIFLLDQTENSSELQALALAAQELREPLSGIMTVTDNLFPLCNDTQNPQILEQTAHLNRGLYQILRILSNMSDAYMYSQTQQANLELRNVGEVIGEIIEKSKELIRHAQVTVTFSGLSQDVYSLIDTEKLERGISNLLSNALKFTSKGGTIQTQLRQKHGMLYLTVQNTGDGIPTSIRSNLFNRYLRQPGLEDSRHGIGLGMVLIRTAAAVHGGTVLIQQTENMGTTLTLTIPIRQKSNIAVRSSILHVDYTGERDHALVEFSEILPSDLYKTETDC